MGDYKALNAGSPDTSQASGQSMQNLSEMHTPDTGLTTAEAQRRLARDG